MVAMERDHAEEQASMCYQVRQSFLVKLGLYYYGLGKDQEFFQTNQ